MIFNSTEFLVFFCLVFILYYGIQRKGWQLAVLLVSSLIFYGWNSPNLLALLGFCVLLNSSVSFLVSRARDHKLRVAIAALGVLTNLAVLGTFKYAGMIATFFEQFLHINASGNDFASALVNLPLPVGISFFTFEGISLLVDTVRGGAPVAGFGKHLRDTALFITFFPHLVAGPIVRPHQFFPQIGVKKLGEIDWNFASERLITGYFLKVVIADHLAGLTTNGFHDTYCNSAIALLAFMMAFSIKLFSDFAGYSYIAIGLASLLGYRLPDNFDWPFRAQSLSEFWRRWHMTLTAWLRDYVYIPLGGSRVGVLRTDLNVMIVLLLGGLWHGAAFHFVVFGAWHGIGLCAERIFGWREVKSTNWLVHLFRAVCVFVFVSIGFVFFALQTDQALTFFKNMLINWHTATDWTRVEMAMVLSAPVILWHFAVALRDAGVKLQMPKLLPAKLAWDALLAVMLFLIVVNPGQQHTFVYFQF